MSQTFPDYYAILGALPFRSLAFLPPHPPHLRQALAQVADVEGRAGVAEGHCTTRASKPERLR